MSPEEFVLWLKGFTEGVHEFNITPKQWDTLKDKLATVTLLGNKEVIGKQLLKDQKTHFNYILKEQDGK